MKFKELVSLLYKNGWNLDRIKGSHYIFVKMSHRSIPVPKHGKEVPKSLASRILKQAKISNKE